ncbi:MAG: hypothetical protein COS89_06235 [Deltaproteobacteria bacterium CG07_land_8_20_14_0_80_38_7]|nr:MAG: hypothetical protein COS89_06235 [Deltaproteobacteria bacterium CG07_land_8_20_14_0_80_38_7]
MRKRINFIVVVAMMFFVSSTGFCKAKKVAHVKETYPVTRQFIYTTPLLNNSLLTITVVDDSTREEYVKSLIDGIFADVSRMDNVVANDIARINSNNNKNVELSSETYDLISKSKNLATLTNGWFDITTSSDKGYFSPKDYRKIKLNSSKNTLTFKGKNMGLDIKHILPAFLVDRIMESLVNSGVANAKVDIDGISRNVGKDIYTPWIVSIDLPNPNSNYTHRSYAYSFSNKSVAVLTPNLIKKPLIDPKARKEVPDNFINVTVFSDKAMTSSAIAYALYTIGDNGAMPFIEQHPESKVICVNNKGEFANSKGLHIQQQNYESGDASAAPTVDMGPSDLKMRMREEETDAE